MNRFERLLGCSLVSTSLIALTVAGCPAPGSDGSSDNSNANDNSDSEVEVNSAPVASAGDDQTATSGNLVVLNAGATADANGDRLQYLWGQIGGQPTVVLQDGFSSAPRFFVPTVTATTVLTFRLTVGDGQAISFDDVLVTINP